MAPTNEKLSLKVDQLENPVSDGYAICIELGREIRKLIDKCKNSIPVVRNSKGLTG